MSEVKEAMPIPSKRNLPQPKRIAPRNNRQQTKNAIPKELNNNQEGTNVPEEKKSLAEAKETSIVVIKAVGNESPVQVQSSTSKAIAVPIQPRKSQFRPSTAPPALTEANSSEPIASTSTNAEVIDFLKGIDASSTSYQDCGPNPGGPNTSNQPNELGTPSLASCLRVKSSKTGLKKTKPKSAATAAVGTAKLKPPSVDSTIVTFSPETVNIERENKPRRARSHKNNRKPKFAHPCCGHFLPPTQEIMSFDGPMEDMDNIYTKYTQVWTHPSQRTSAETNLKWNIRKTRFDKLLGEVSQIHRAFNTFSDEMKTKCLKKEILPRYVMALDIVLTDGDTEQVDSLTKTVESSIRVTQSILHDDFFDEEGKPREISQVPPEGPGYLQDLGMLISALNKISSNRPRQETTFLGFESAFSKLQFELLSLSLCPTETVLFRCLVSVIPFTLRRIKKLLQEVRERDDSDFYIKWVNNSVLYRDYMAIMKDLGLADENGAKDELPNTSRKAKLKDSFNTRPLSADADLRRPAERNHT